MNDSDNDVRAFNIYTTWTLDRERLLLGFLGRTAGSLRGFNNTLDPSIIPDGVPDHAVLRGGPKGEFVWVW